MQNGADTKRIRNKRKRSATERSEIKSKQLRGLIEDAHVPIISCNFSFDVILIIVYRLFPISYLFPLINLEGPQLKFPRLVSWMKFETQEDYEKYFSRLEAFPTQVHVLIYWL